MATTKKRKGKDKRKVRVSTKAKVRKKSEQPKDTLKKMDAQMPRTVAPVLKIKVRKK